MEKVDQLARVDDSIRKIDISTSYGILGEFQATIPRYIKDTLTQVDAGHGTQHENSLYLNSSDSLESLMQLDLSGQRIMTVSGSGEFAHTLNPFQNSIS